MNIILQAHYAGQEEGEKVLVVCHLTPALQQRIKALRDRYMPSTPEASTSPDALVSVTVIVNQTDLWIPHNAENLYDMLDASQQAALDDDRWCVVRPMDTWAVLADDAEAWSTDGEVVELTSHGFFFKLMVRYGAGLETPWFNYDFFNCETHGDDPYKAVTCMRCVSRGLT